MGLFLWGLAAFSIEQRWVFIFYLLAGLMFLVFKLYLKSKLKTESNIADINGSEPGGRISGFKHFLFSMAVGGFLYMLASILSTSKGQIIGAPTLAITSTQSFLDWLTLQFAPLISGTLGTFENALWIGILVIVIDTKEIWGQGLNTVFEALIAGTAAIPYAGLILSMMFTAFATLVSVMGIILPFAFVCFLFGIFHINAYALAWSVMLWAMTMMGFMIASYYITGKDITAMDLFHFAWNGKLTVNESLTIAF